MGRIHFKPHRWRRVPATSGVQQEFRCLDCPIHRRDREASYRSTPVRYVVEDGGQIERIVVSFGSCQGAPRLADGTDRLRSLKR